MPSPNFGSYRELNPSILCNPLSHKCFCSKETLEEHLAQDAAQVFLWIKNTQNPRVRFPVGTQKFGECILSTSQAGLRRRARVSRRTDHPSYRESGPLGCNFLSRKCFIPKKHSSRILRKMLLECFFGIKTPTQRFVRTCEVRMLMFFFLFP